ncbi:MAG TPA: hypothetical protein VGM51_17385 [Armatimonadota bacterium]|jgi:hypothetical protein
MKSRTLIALAGLTFGLAGCGKPVGSGPSNSAAPAALVAGSGATVTVTIKEWNITVEPAAVQAGTVTLKMRNTGKQPHGIYLEGPSVDRKTPRLEPGASTDLTLSVPSGDFSLTDFVKDNEFTHGMKANLHCK